MRLVLTYDVTDDTDRARFFRKLRRFLTPVQRSVFEGTGDPAVLDDVERLVGRELDLAVENIRIYVLCDGCAARTRQLGVALTPPDPALPWVL